MKSDNVVLDKSFDFAVRIVKFLSTMPRTDEYIVTDNSDNESQ